MIIRKRTSLKPIHAQRIWVRGLARQRAGPGHKVPRVHIIAIVSDEITTPVALPADLTAPKLHQTAPGFRRLIQHTLKKWINCAWNWRKIHLVYNSSTPRTRSSMDRASDFELCEGGVHPFHGGKSCPSSLWRWQQSVYNEHSFHPFHPNCTRIAPNQLVWQLVYFVLLNFLFCKESLPMAYLLFCL